MTNFFLVVINIILCLVIADGDPFKGFTEPMKECYRKAAVSLNNCQEDVAKEWNCAITGKQTIELSCGEGEGRTCCPLWFVFRCHQNIIKDQCGDGPLNEFNKILFDPQIKQIEDNDCTQYKYSSDRCQQLLDLDLNAVVVPGEAPAVEPGSQPSSTKHEDIPTDSSRIGSEKPQQITNNSDFGRTDNRWQIVFGFISFVFCFFKNFDL